MLSAGLLAGTLPFAAEPLAAIGRDQPPVALEALFDASSSATGFSDDTSLAAGGEAAGAAGGSVIPGPFWRKPDGGPTYAPAWYANKGDVTREVFYDAGLSPAQNGVILEQVLENLSTGDHVVVHAGTYLVDSWFKIQAQGTAEQPIVIRGAPDEEVVITRSNAEKNVIDIVDSRYLILEGLGIRGGSIGLRIYDADHLMVYDCEIHDTSGNAIAANSNDTSYLYFVDNDIHDTGGHGEGFYLGSHDGTHVTHHTYVIGNYVHDLMASDVSQGDGIEIKDKSYANVVKYNFVKNTNYPGIIVYGTGRGADGRNLIEENVVINSRDYAIQASAEAVIRNNLVIKGGGGALLSKPESSNPKYLAVVNNTFVNEGRAMATYGWDASDAVEIVCANNAIYSGTGEYIHNGTGNALASCNVFLDDLATAFVNLDSSGESLDATPRDGSPLIDSGDAQFLPAVDLHGRTRITGVDVGAVDFQADAATVQIIDNGEPGFSSSGDWTWYAGVGLGFGDDGCYSWRGPGADVATWTFSVSPGAYQVAATWLAFINRAANAPYRVLDGSTELATVRVDQRMAPDDFTDSDYGRAWDVLGTFEITGGTLTVELSDDANGYVIADAIRVERVGDLAPVQIAESGGSTEVGEGGATSDTYDVVLRAPPAGDVVITVTPDGQVNAAPSELTFTLADWDAPQTVAVTAVDDGLVEGAHTGTITHSAASTDGQYHGIAIGDVVARIADNDTQIVDNGDAGFSVSGDWTSYEGAGLGFGDDGGYSWRGSGSDVASWTFTVSPGKYQVAATWLPFINRASNAPYEILDASTPLAAVQIDQRAAPDDFADSEYGSNWEVLGTFEILSDTLTVMLSDEADRYVIADAVRIERVGDPDPVRIVESGGSTEVAEEGPTTDTYEVALLTAPTGDVVITLTPDDQVTASPTTLTFTSANWDTAQTVTVTARDDVLAEPRVHTGTITHSAASTDAKYNNVAIAAVAANVSDNEIKILDDGGAGFTVSGDWTPYQGSGLGFENDGCYTWRGDGSDAATWSFAVLPGTYQVAATWLPFINRATNAPYRVFDGAKELATVLANQQVAPDDLADSDYGGNWEVLGTFEILSDVLTVKLSDDANGYVIADAIRIERVA